jgi:alginate O-acetyltransferase complex protein AlgI
MLFSSFSYLFLFLPVTILVCSMACRVVGPRAAQLVVLFASLAFYGWWLPRNLFYLAASILANWLIARWMLTADMSSRKRILQTGLALNVLYLCLFKFVDFFLQIVPYFSHWHMRWPGTAFPLGISFFTLSQIMYLVDCYEGLVPAGSFFDHATFVSFFPYVISGPIARAGRMRHQFGNFGGGEQAALMARGFYLFMLGLTKKVVLADSFARIADPGFASQMKMSPGDALIISVAYTLQIYFDFSGYSDMAMGSAMMLGIEIPRNFDTPLRSLSIIEFWQRWHITLSNFITTYLYTPLLKSFSRATVFTAAISTFIAMSIAGLWHGPAMTFVLFGMLHGAGLIVNQYWRKKKILKLPAWISWLCTFALVDVAFIVFRSPSVHFALQTVQSMGHLSMLSHLPVLQDIRSSFSTIPYVLPWIIGLIVAFRGRSSDQLSREFAPTPGTASAAVAMAVISFVFMNLDTSQNFLYFKF